MVNKFFVGQKEVSINETKIQIVNKIKNSDWFEGILSFAVGLKAKTLYRVQELPTLTATGKWK